MFAQLEVAGRERQSGVHAFVVPIRQDGRPAPGVRIEDDGLKMGLNGVDNGRLWFDQVRVPREALLNRFADVSEDGTYSSDDREPEPALLHDARHPGPGPGLRRRRRHQRQQGRAGHRDPLRAAGAGSSRRPRRTRRSCCSTTGSTSAGCSRCWPTPTRCTSRRRWSPASATRCSPARWTTRSSSASSSRARPAPRRSAPGTRPAPSRSAARRAAAPATWPENRFAALKADTDVFTTFEGDNTVLLQLVAKGLLTDYSSELRGPRPARDGPVRRRARGRDRGRADQRAQARSSGSATCCPAATSGTRRPGCSTRTTSSRCCASARSTCWPASPAGSSAASTRG